MANSRLPASFDQWTIADALSALRVPKWVEENEAFYEGDHWQKGIAWRGPHINPDTGVEGGDAVMKEIARGFVSSNAIKEVTLRHRDAVVGNPVGWHVVPRRFLKKDEELTTQEESDIREIEAALTNWWNGRRVMLAVQQAVTRLLLAPMAVVRLFVPNEFLDPVVDEEGRETGELTKDVETLEEALRLVVVDEPGVRHATIWENPLTKERAAIVHIVDPEDASREVVEMTFVDRRTGETVFRRLTRDETRVAERMTVPLGERMPVVGMTLKDGPFITEQVRQHQRALNLAATMIPRTVITSGFLERTMLNAMMPGEWELDSEGQRTKFIPASSIRLGAGVTSWVQGVNYKDGVTGEDKVLDPEVVYREPIEPKGAITAVGAHYQAILAETKQEHVLTNTMALMSGKSREQARSGFATSTKPTKEQVEYLVSELLETTLALGEFFLGRPGLYTSLYRINAICRPDTGPSSSDEREQDVKAVDSNLMSMETAMERANIVDVDAEQARIAKNPLFKLVVLTKQFEAMKMAVEAQVDPESAARLIGLPKDIIIAEPEPEPEPSPRPRLTA